LEFQRDLPNEAPLAFPLFSDIFLISRSVVGGRRKKEEKKRREKIQSFIVDNCAA